MYRYVAAAAALSAGLLLSACETDPPPPEEPIPLEQQIVEPERFLYECPDGFAFQVVMLEDAVELVLPDTTLMLPRVEARSGARYRSGGYEYWSRDAEAMLDLPAETRHGCIPDRATPAWE